MKNKKNAITNVKSTIFFILVGIFIYNFLNGIKLNFPGLTQTSLLSRFSDIHFSSPGNNFGGGIFWLNSESLQKPQTITAGSETITCSKKLRGIYYNAARGARLWPLDENTFELLNKDNGYTGLELTGGIFTACEGYPYGIFGYIKYNRGGTESHIIAGTKLNYQLNNFESEFTNSFEYFNNVTPLGYIWDSVGGIGFVGGSIQGSEALISYINNNGGSINTSFTNSGNNIISTNSNRSIVGTGDSQAQDTMWNILIQGNTFISTAIAPDEKRALLGNIEKRTILMLSDLNPSDIINKAKKNAEILCRGKTYFTTQVETTTLPENNKDSVLCYKNTKNLEIDLSQELHKDKTIVMKNGNITFKNSMQKESPPLDLFIDGGLLFVKNNPGQKINFNENGYPSEIDPKTKGTFMKGNIVVNGLLVGGEPEDIEQITHKVHLLGKIVFLNTPITPSEGRKVQVNSVLNTQNYESRINLENVFAWYCNFGGQASDGTTCGSGQSSATIVPFVVLNASYPSKIIK